MVGDNSRFVGNWEVNFWFARYSGVAPPQGGDWVVFAEGLSLLAAAATNTERQIGNSGTK